MGFQVKDVTLEAPDWVTDADRGASVVITISFDRAVNETTVRTPQTVRVDLKGTNDGRFKSSVAGTLRFSGDSTTVVFISNWSLTKLINPQAGENIEYTTTFLDTGANVITDSSGEALSGRKVWTLAAIG